MKRFKSYLTEIINDGSQFQNPEFHQLHDRLLGIINQHMETTGPEFSIPEKSDPRPYAARVYKWNNWHKAINALSSSISSHHLMSGMLTGGSPEEADAHGNFILDKHSQALRQFGTQHSLMLSDLHRNNPEARSIIDRLTEHYGMPFADISDLHLENRLNQTLQGHQSHLHRSMRAIPFRQHGQIIDNEIRAHNKKVSKHGHPLGLFLNGGHSVDHNGIDDGHGGSFAPDSVTVGNRENFDDVTHKYFPERNK